MRRLLVTVILAGLVFPAWAAEGRRPAGRSKRPPAAKPADRRPRAPEPPEPRDLPPARARPPADSRTAATDAQPSGPAADSGNVSPGGKTPKVKVYTFTGLDVDGKLKSPQLLYFLNRMQLELDASAPDRRSFMKELERTAQDPNL